MNALPLDRAREVHDRLLAALRDRRAAEHAAALLLRQVADEQLHHAFGHASVYEYAEQRLDLTLRQTRAFLQIAGALPSLPALDAAFAEGRLPWTKVREVVRVATPETETAWVEAATRRTSRELESMVSRSVTGQSPPEPDDPRGPARRRVVFEMEASDARVLLDALALLRAEAAVHGEELDDGAALAALGQRLLHDADGDGAPLAERYRIVVHHCPTCDASHAADAEVSETVQAQAACDAELVDLRPGPAHGHLTRTIPPATRRAVLHRDGLRCVVPGCRCRLWLDLHHLEPRSLGGTHDSDNLVTLCPIHHRLAHEGLLAVRRRRDGEVEVVHADGRRSVTRRRPTWVAQAGASSTTMGGHGPCGDGPPGPAA
ncbi:MAG: HNH endonuclease [Alphaproteobacteria bacterium]|nr:HNH endonuclease [Alphaproteobacteria bacterium]